MSADHDPHILARSGTEDHQYFLKRAEDHRILAENADELSVRTIHLYLQQLYQDRADLAATVVSD